VAVVNNGIIKLIEINYVSTDPLNNWYKHNIFIFLTFVISLEHFPKKSSGAGNVARKLKVHKNKHKQLLSSLYVYRRNVNHGVRNKNVC